jgi:hypothetical protein
MRQAKIIAMLLILSFMLPSAYGSFFGNVPDGLKDAFKAGDSKEIAKYFGVSVEMEILGEENVYTKAQAEQVINQFIEQHPVTGFSLLFEGGKDASKFAIAKLTTQKGKYRISLLVKNQIVIQLRIEEENGN